MSIVGRNGDCMTDRLHPDHLSYCTGSINVPVPLETMKVPFGMEGDLVIAQVREVNRFCSQLESREGGEVQLRVGDTLLGALGSAYSLSSFSGKPPVRLDARLDLLSKDGILGECTGFHRALEWPTSLYYLGSVIDHGSVVRVRPRIGRCFLDGVVSTPVVLVVGTDSDVGKTTLCGQLIRFLSSEGLVVHGGKFLGVTGQQDLRYMSRLGARKLSNLMKIEMLRQDASELQGSVQGILMDLLQPEPDLIVLECGGGVFLEKELVSLVSAFRTCLRNLLLVICARDLAAVWAMLAWLRSAPRLENLSVLISGKVTDSTLGVDHIENQWGIAAANALDGIGKIRDLLKSLFPQLKGPINASRLSRVTGANDRFRTSNDFPPCAGEPRRP